MSVFTSSAVPMNCAYCGKPVLEDAIYWSGLCYHKQCTNPHNPLPMDRAPTPPPYEAFLKMQIIEKDKRIAALEAVAEAALQSVVNKHGIWVGPTVTQTLKAAGYLGEGND